MGFIESYKRLDNLCKDLFCSNTGVSSYINEMEQCYLNINKIPGWDSDYHKFKHYRYIRNKIAHENGASESALCNPNDAFWIEEFYQKILNREDPLAQYSILNNRLKRQTQKDTYPKPDQGRFRYVSQTEQYNISKFLPVIVAVVIFFIVFLSLLVNR